jgi:hypothetical protein
MVALALTGSAITGFLWIGNNWASFGIPHVSLMISNLAIMGSKMWINIAATESMDNGIHGRKILRYMFYVFATISCMAIIILPVHGQGKREYIYLNDRLMAVESSAAPFIRVVSPTAYSTYYTMSNNIILSGNAYESITLSQVYWTNDRGGTGTCSGTSSFICSNVELQSGENKITIIAIDVLGNTNNYIIKVYLYPNTTLSYSPADIPPSVADGMDDEFNGGPGFNAKWTSASLGSSYNINQTWNGWIYSRGKDVAVDKVDLSQSFAPGTSDFSFTVKCGGMPRAGAQSVRLILGDAGLANQAMIAWQFNGGDNTIRITWNKMIAGVWTYWMNTANVTNQPINSGTWYLHLQRIGGTFDVFYSRNGIDWTALTINYSIPNISGSNLVKVMLQIAPDGQGSTKYCLLGIDWFRHNWLYLDR